MRISRRRFIETTGSAALGVSAMAHAAKPASKAKLVVTGLRTAQLDNPIGLADPAPMLSWRMEGNRRGIMQLAYRILVATSPELLRAGKGNLWDSGRIASGVSTGVAYAGTVLKSRQRVWWQVTVWDNHRQSATSDSIAFWEAPLLNATDWTASWIAAETIAEREDREAGMPAFTAPVPPPGKPRLFRLPFSTGENGTVILTLFSTGFMENVTVDGVPIQMPPHPRESYGSPAAARFEIPLDAGAHMLAAEVLPPRGFVPAKDVSVAAQLRLPASDSRIERLSTGWQTSVEATGEWRQPGDNSSGWTDLTSADPKIAHPAWPAGPAMVLRHVFAAPARPKQARLYIAALGAFEARINGRAVSEDRLQSETADYRKTIPYRVYDVSTLLERGENVLGVTVGDGWYASYMAPAGRYALGPAPRRLIAQLEVDGRLVAQTGDGWRMDLSPVTSSELYNGEVYDARLEQPGWDKAGFDDSRWTPCWSAGATPGQLTAQADPAVRITRSVNPKNVVRLDNGDVVVDFGQNFAGLAALKVKGAAGTKIIIRFAEILGPDGSVDQRNLRAAMATDIYTLRGDPKGESFLPRFTFHGFRYVQLSGLPERWEVEGKVMSSALRETGLLRIDNPVIQKFWLNTLWSQRSNFLSIPTDCPQRDERLGWTGDAQVFWDTAAFNMDVAAFTRRYLRDLRDAQTFKGAFPIFAPTVSNPPGASPGWADAGVMLPWICWRRYGDTAMVAEHWDAMCRYVDGVIADNPDMIWRKVFGPDFGDWLALDAKAPGDPTTPKDLVATAMLKRSLDQLADMGEAIGKAAKAASYRTLADKAARAFQAAFVNADGTIGNDSQTGYILATRLAMLTPGQARQAIVHLTANIKRRGTLLSTGFLGTPLSLDALADGGEFQLVYDLLLRTKFPSWGYMVKRGATTIWERWNGDSGDIAMNSFNHYALGAVVGFLYRRIAGIDPIEPGFAKFRVAPLLDSRVGSASADYDSVRGRISTRWSITAGGFELDVDVPANTLAELQIPVQSGSTIKESGRNLADVDGIRHVEKRSDIQIVTIGSGKYRFATVDKR